MFNVKQRAAHVEIKLDAIRSAEWSRDRVRTVLLEADSEALHEIRLSHALYGRAFTAGRQVATWAHEILNERGLSDHRARLSCMPAPDLGRQVRFVRDDKTYTATITEVISPTIVNLHVLDHNGHDTFGFPGAELDPSRKKSGSWHWPVY